MSWHNSRDGLQRYLIPCRQRPRATLPITYGSNSWRSLGAVLALDYVLHSRPITAVVTISDPGSSTYRLRAKALEKSHAPGQLG